MSNRDRGELVFAEYDGWLVCQSAKAIGIGPIVGGEPVLWVPKSIAGLITYVDGGDSREVRVRKKIEAFQVQRWWALEQQLISSNE